MKDEYKKFIFYVKKHHPSEYELTEKFPGIMAEYTRQSPSDKNILEWAQNQVSDNEKTDENESNTRVASSPWIYPNKEPTVVQHVTSLSGEDEEKSESLVDKLSEEVKKQYWDLYDRVAGFIRTLDSDKICLEIQLNIPIFVRKPYEKAVTILFEELYDESSEWRMYSHPLHVVLDALRLLSQFHPEFRKTVQLFISELESIVQLAECHDVDEYRKPISREDRLYGTLRDEGEYRISKDKIANWAPTAVDSDLGLTVPVMLYRYGSQYFFVNKNDKPRTGTNADGRVLGRVFAIVAGSSAARRTHSLQTIQKSLSIARRLIDRGANVRQVAEYFDKKVHGVVRHIWDYAQKTSVHNFVMHGTLSGYQVGDLPMSNITQQTSDECGGCTYNAGTGGTEFGYGFGKSILSDLFLNSPNEGFGRGDPAAYDPQRTPGQGRQ